MNELQQLKLLKLSEMKTFALLAALTFASVKGQAQLSQKEAPAGPWTASRYPLTLHRLIPERNLFLSREKLIEP